MAHPIPAPRASLNPWPPVSVRLVRALIRIAWSHGYNAVPRDGGAHPVVLLHPRDGLWSDRSARLHLAPHGPGAEPWWHWSETGRPLGAAPADARALITEIDQNLTGGDFR